MINEEEIEFYGGMNSDDEDRRMPDGDYREAFYLRESSFVAGSSGILENLPGNVLVNNGSLAAGTNTVIGGCAWIEDSSIIYFVHNTNGNHSIWKYKTDTGAISLIVQSSVLNFQVAQKIVNPFVVDGLLFWTDGYFTNYAQVSTNIFGYNPPRMGSIARLAAGSYTIDFQVFDVIKWPPSFAPDVVYANNTDPAINLWGSLFQFSYKYIYDNNEESCWGPISELPIPVNGYLMTGKTPLVTQDNQIDVTFNSGSQQVVKVILGVRVGNSEPFHEWLTVDKTGLSNNTNYTKPFTNSSFGESVPLNAPLFHFVPQIAGAQELLTGRGGELSYADIREGYDNLALNITLTYGIRAITLQNQYAVTFGSWVNQAVLGPMFQIVYDFTTSIIGYSEGDIIVFQIWDRDFPITTGVQSYFFTVTTEQTVDDLVTAVGVFLTAEGFTVAVNLGNDTVTVDDATVPGASQTNGQGTLIIIRPVNPQRTWKTGTTHKIGLKYEDRANRSGTVQYVEAGELVLPSYSQIDTSGLSNIRNPFVVIPQLSITHTAPIWSTHYRVCVQHSTTISSFMWTTVDAAFFPPQTPNRIRLALNQFYVANFGVGPVHQIAPGDKVRFIRKPSDFNSAFANWGDYVGTGQDYVFTIIAWYPEINEIDVEYFDYNDYDTNNLVLAGAEIEIFRERQTGENEVWFELPIALSILNPNTANRQHSGATVTGSVVSMTFATQIGVMTGDLSAYVGRSIGILTGDANDGLYTIATAVYDSINDETDLTFAQVFPTDSAAGTYSINLQQTALLPAIIFMGGDEGCGDIYLRPRLRTSTAGGGRAPQEEDPAYTDYWPSSWWSKGRVGQVDDNSENKRLVANVVHSKNYLDNTNVNGLNVFEVQDREQLNEADGIIDRIIMVGDTLQCLQGRKNTSIYIQRAVALDPTGSVTYSESDKTFGGKRPREEDFGLIHGSSAIKVDGSVFYYDFLNGKFIESTNNGQRSISDGEYKFNAASAALTTQVSSVSGLFVLGYHDMQNNEVGWLFSWSTGQKIVVYNYSRQRWKYYKDYRPSWIMNLGETLVEWSGAQLYKANQVLNVAAPNYNTFFASVKNSTVKFVSRKPQQYIKRWGTIRVKSYGSAAPWALTQVDIPANLSYTAMQSRIPATSFNVVEGEYSATYKRDLNSPNFTTQVLALVGGRELRGVAATHLLTLTGEDEHTILSSVKILTETSEAAL